MKINGIAHVVLTVSNFEAAVPFYERLLAFLVPTIIVLLTCLVGAIILSVLLPIYDLTNAIG